MEEEKYIDEIVEKISELKLMAAGRMDEMMLHYKYEIGKSITESPLYQKGSWGMGKLIGEVSSRLGKGWKPESLQDSIKFFVAVEERYPKIGAGKAMSAIVRDFGSWTAVRSEWGIRKLSTGILNLKSTTCTHFCQYHAKVTSEQQPLLGLPAGDEAKIDAVMRLFEKVNHSWEKLIARKAERRAVRNLLKTYGWDQVEKVVALVAKTNGMRYAPSINTPKELEEKYEKLAQFAMRLKGQKQDIGAIKV